MTSERDHADSSLILLQFPFATAQIHHVSKLTPGFVLSHATNVSIHSVNTTGMVQLDSLRTKLFDLSRPIPVSLEVGELSPTGLLHASPETIAGLAGLIFSAFTGSPVWQETGFAFVLDEENNAIDYHHRHIKGTLRCMDDSASASREGSRAFPNGSVARVLHINFELAIEAGHVNQASAAAAVDLMLAATIEDGLSKVLPYAFHQHTRRRMDSMLLYDTSIKDSLERFDRQMIENHSAPRYHANWSDSVEKLGARCMADIQKRRMPINSVRIHLTSEALNQSVVMKERSSGTSRKRRKKSLPAKSMDSVMTSNDGCNSASPATTEASEASRMSTIRALID